ncbi:MULTISPECIES: SMI1/KNR4 family protein [Burkholderia]|uniref:Knr4/Smi1-like domain-containing protein n=1 Tax=Burkholderia aenigmatica TaxID=2015348 RepID=A0A228J3W7_9BURK|nr:MULTISPECIES: SMI1/KNR4 family protein [Burkholderia]MBN3839908.1 SMI1/KNR4 family protein [Burkholderia sp. Ac-20349]OXI49531.1 hypothetical protein CFB84_01980 [Burkholderia aenigmatica]
MSVQFKRLGMSEAEIDREERDSKRKFKASRRMEMISVYNAPLPSGAELDQLEHQVGASLPLEYRRFLEKVNGGEPSGNLLWSGDRERVVNYLFSSTVPRGSIFSIEKNMETYGARFPKELICIGSAGGGDLILLSIKGDKVGGVYYWSHSFESESNGDEYWGNIEQVSDSLSHFFDMLHD